MNYFLDSSALIKRYVNEQGSNWVRSRVSANAGNTIAVAQVTRVEVVSGIARRKREGTVPTRTADAIYLLINRHTKRDYLVVALTDPILDRAAKLLSSYPLRAYDSLQLASALITNTKLLADGLTPLTFVCADKQLLNAAAVEGLAVSDPNNYP